MLRNYLGGPRVGYIHFNVVPDPDLVKIMRNLIMVS
jgi:hypothetical protein